MTHPLRVRVRDDTDVHAAERRIGEPAWDLRTACNLPGSVFGPHPDKLLRDTPITCPACRVALKTPTTKES